MVADMKRVRPILEEVVLAKYDGERPTKPFLTPVNLHTNPPTGHTQSWGGARVKDTKEKGINIG